MSPRLAGLPGPRRRALPVRAEMLPTHAQPAPQRNSATAAPSE